MGAREPHFQRDELRVDEDAASSDVRNSLERSKKNVPASRCCSMLASGLASGGVTPNAQMSDCVGSSAFGMSKASMEEIPDRCGRSGTHSDWDSARWWQVYRRTVLAR